MIQTTSETTLLTNYEILMLALELGSPNLLLFFLIHLSNRGQYTESWVLCGEFQSFKLDLKRTLRDLYLGPQQIVEKL